MASSSAAEEFEDVSRRMFTATNGGDLHAAACAFETWVYMHRDLIARALRLAAIVENPSDADMAALASAIVKMLLRGTTFDPETNEPVNVDPRAILAALRERVEVKDA